MQTETCSSNQGEARRCSAALPLSQRLLLHSAVLLHLPQPSQRAPRGFLAPAGPARTEGKLVRERPKLLRLRAAVCSGRSPGVGVLPPGGEAFPCTYLTLVLVQMMYSISSE